MSSQHKRKASQIVDLTRSSPEHPTYKGETVSSESARHTSLQGEQRHVLNFPAPNYSHDGGGATHKQTNHSRHSPNPPTSPSASERDSPSSSNSEPRYVYAIHTSHRINVGADDPRGFYNDYGDLKDVTLGIDIFENLDDANEAAREHLSDVCEEVGLSDVEPGEVYRTVMGSKEKGLCVAVDAYEEMESWKVEVLGRRLR